MDKCILNLELLFSLHLVLFIPNTSHKKIIIKVRIYYGNTQAGSKRLLHLLLNNVRHKYPEMETTLAVKKTKERNNFPFDTMQYFTNYDCDLDHSEKVQIIINNFRFCLLQLTLGSQYNGNFSYGFVAQVAYRLKPIVFLH